MTDNVHQHEPTGAPAQPDPSLGAPTPAPADSAPGAETPTLEPDESFAEPGPSDPGADVYKRELIIQAKTEYGLVMSVSHYTRIQKRIRKEIGGPSTSIWLALSLAFLSIGATIVVTLESTTNVDATTKGKLEVAAWACLVIAGIFAIFHFIRDREKRKTADDICNEMDESSGRSSED